jgi:hypothetical protein
LSRWDLNKKFTQETVHSLHQSSDYMLALSHPENILDKSLRFVAMTLLICSYAYEEVKKINYTNCLFSKLQLDLEMKSE